MRDLGWAPDQDPTGKQCGLQALYRTNMLRTRAHANIMRSEASADSLGEVELALDLGHIEAGQRQTHVRELEIELISGSPMAVIEAARRLVLEHNLWLDSQTKAHRGDQLAKESQLGHSCPQPPARTRTKSAAQDASPQARWLQAWNTAIEQVSLNLSEVALGGDKQAWAHAAATGLRRLRFLSRHQHAAKLTSSWLLQLNELLATLRPSHGQEPNVAQIFKLSRAPHTTLWLLDALEMLIKAEA